VKRARVGAWAAVVAACLCVGWFARQRGAEDVMPEPLPHAADAALASQAKMHAGAAGPDPVAASRVPIGASAPAAALADCAGLPIAADAPGQAALAARRSGDVQAALAGLAESLKGDHTERARVAGLYVLQLARHEAAVTAAGWSPLDPAPIGGAEGEAALAAMARIASASGDGALYGFVFRQCRGPLWGGLRDGSPRRGCEQLSVARRAQLEPDNAQPWLTMAAETAARPAEQAEALHRAAQATRSDDGVGWLTRWLRTRLPPSQTPEARLAALQTLWMAQLSVAGEIDAASAVSRSCSEHELRNANRQQACLALARQLLRSDSRLQRVIGLRVAERAGIPAPELAPVDASNAEQQRGVVQQSSERAGCAETLRQTALLESLVQHGEGETLRRAGAALR